MKLPVQVTFRNMDPSTKLEAMIQRRAARLDAYYDRVMACRVLVEVPHRHHQEGNRYHVRIDLTVPDDEIVVTHEPSLHSSLKDIDRDIETKAANVAPVHKYVGVAVREAFDIARRRLQDYGRRQRGAVKVHQSPLHGTVGS